MSFIKHKFKNKNTKKLPTKDFEIKYFCSCNKDALAKFRKAYNMELEAKFGRLEKEKGLTYSDSMSDLSDIDYDFSDDEKKKDPENQE